MNFAQPHDPLSPAALAAAAAADVVVAMIVCVCVFCFLLFYQFSPSLVPPPCLIVMVVLFVLLSVSVRALLFAVFGGKFETAGNSVQKRSSENEYRNGAFGGKTFTLLSAAAPAAAAFAFVCGVTPANTKVHIPCLSLRVCLCVCVFLRSAMRSG